MEYKNINDAETENSAYANKYVHNVRQEVLINIGSDKKHYLKQY